MQGKRGMGSAGLGWVRLGLGWRPATAWAASVLEEEWLGCESQAEGAEPLHASWAG